MTLVRVRGQSTPGAVAGAIAGLVRKQEPVEVQAIGASAVNQAVKALAIACRLLEDDPEPVGLVFAPKFVELEIEGKEVAAVRLTVLQMSPPSSPRPTLRVDTVAD